MTDHDRIRAFFNAVGRKAIQERLGCGPAALSDAIRAGKIPARYFRACEIEAGAAGVDVPVDLFDFRLASPPDEAAA